MSYRVYAATKLSGVFYSSDFEIDSSNPTWTAINTGLPNGNIFQFMVDYVDPEQTQYVLHNDNNDIYRRQNSGDWELILSQADARTVAGETTGYIAWITSDEETEGTLYALFNEDVIAGSIDIHILKSTDYGDTWSVFTTYIGALAIYGISNLIVRGDTLWFCVTSGFGAARGVVQIINGSTTIVYSDGAGGGACIVSWMNDTDKNIVLIQSFSSGANITKLTSDGVSSIVAVSNLASIWIESEGAIWYDPSNAAHFRVGDSLGADIQYTLNTWTSETTTTFGGLRSVYIIKTVPNNIVPVMLGLSSTTAAVSAIGYLADESSTSVINKAGANWNSSPYTNSIPACNVSNGICHLGLFFLPAGQKIYVHGVEGEPVIAIEEPLPGDRSAFDVNNFDTLHASDIDQNALLRHLPSPVGEDDDNIAYVQSDLWIVGPITDILPNNGLAALFLYNDASISPATYKRMLPDHSTGAKETISVAGLTDGAVIEEFISNSGSPGSHFLLDGMYEVHIHAAKTAGNKTLKIYAEIYTRTDPGGVETLIGTTEMSTALSAAETGYDLHLALSEIDIDLTDRMVVKIVADVTGSGTNPTGALYVEGDTFSRFEFPAISVTTVTEFDRILVDENGDVMADEDGNVLYEE